MCASVEGDKILFFASKFVSAVQCSSVNVCQASLVLYMF